MPNLQLGLVPHYVICPLREGRGPKPEENEHTTLDISAVPQLSPAMTQNTWDLGFCPRYLLV